MKGRLFRILKWSVFTFAALILIFVLVLGPFLLAQLITRAGTRPMDRELTETPADYGIEFEDVTFPSTDGIGLSGWYLGGSERGGVSVACAHGLFRSRHEMLERGVILRRAGFNVLVFDLRRHGKSEGERSGLGYQERLDLLGAVRFLKGESPSDRLVLLGVSMGAAAALLAAADEPNVDGVVVESCFLSLEHTVAHHLKLFWGLPRFPLGYELAFLIARLADFRAEDLDLESAVKRMGRRPILFIAGSGDRRTTVETQLKLYQASDDPRSRFVVIPGATHGAAFRTDPQTYQKALLEFLEEIRQSSRDGIRR